MRRDLTIIVVLTAVVLAFALCYPPQRFWVRDVALDAPGEQRAFEPVEVRSFAGGSRVLIGPWESLSSRPHWFGATRDLQWSPWVDSAAAPTTGVGSFPSLGGLFVEWPWLLGELGLVVLAFGGMLTWAIRRGRRRRAQA